MEDAKNNYLSSWIEGEITDEELKKYITEEEFLSFQKLNILNKINNTESAALVAEKIRMALSDEFIVKDSSLSVAASIGIACYPENGKEPLDLVQSADHAMYQAKNNGGDKVILATS